MKRQKAFFIAQTIIDKYDINVFPDHLAETIGDAEWRYSQNLKSKNHTQTLNNKAIAMAGSKNRPLLVSEDKSGNGTENLNSTKEVQDGKK